MKTSERLRDLWLEEFGKYPVGEVNEPPNFETMVDEDICPLKTQIRLKLRAFARFLDEEDAAAEAFGEKMKAKHPEVFKESDCEREGTDPSEEIESIYQHLVDEWDRGSNNTPPTATLLNQYRCNAIMEWLDDQAKENRKKQPGDAEEECNCDQALKLKEKLKDVAEGVCVYSGPGRGDCEHAVGLPGKSIPGQHDGDDDTVDHTGKPNGWCSPCWREYQLRQLERLQGRLDHALEDKKNLEHALGELLGYFQVNGVPEGVVEQFTRAYNMLLWEWAVPYKVLRLRKTQHVADLMVGNVQRKKTYQVDDLIDNFLEDVGKGLVQAHGGTLADDHDVPFLLRRMTAMLGDLAGYIDHLEGFDANDEAEARLRSRCVSLAAGALLLLIRRHNDALNQDRK